MLYRAVTSETCWEIVSLYTKEAFYKVISVWKFRVGTPLVLCFQLRYLCAALTQYMPQLLPKQPKQKQVISRKVPVPPEKQTGDAARDHTAIQQSLALCIYANGRNSYQ